MVRYGDCCLENMRRALVIGCAERVWDDVDRAHELCSFDTYYIVKLAGAYWDGGQFIWVTLHPEFMDGYKTKRKEFGLHSNYEVVGPLATEVGVWGHCPVDRRVTYRWPGMTSSGSSGLFGVKIALEDGHNRVVLAGIPMTEEANHFTRGKPWKQRDCFTNAWEACKGVYADKTRSVSGGWTEERLKRPTLDWLGVSSSTMDAKSK